MLLYPNFFRQYGVRKAEQLMTPPLPLLELLDLPKHSILHYVPDSGLLVGPASDEFIFRHITKPIMMAHVIENGDFKGSPRRLSISSDQLIRAYQIKNRRFRPMRNLQASTRDDLTLAVYNYGIIPSLYKYQRSLYSEYYRWSNLQAAVWKNIAAVARESDRHQFLQVKLPAALPSVSELRFAEAGITQKTVKVFGNPEAQVLLELWKWFGPERQTSQLGVIARQDLRRVNLIFQDAGRWFTVNLGVLDSWRKASKAELAADPEANAKGMEPERIQKHFLRMMMSLAHCRSVSPAEVVAAVDAQPAGKPSAPAGAAAKGTEPAAGLVIKNDNVDVGAPDDRGEDIRLDEAMDARIEQDLDELEHLAKAAAAATPEADEQAPLLVMSEPTLVEGVMRVCDRMADANLLSAAEYRRYSTLATSFQSIISPDGKTTLEEFIKVPAEALVIKESTQIPENPTVLDKSMLKSSLLEFDERYIKEVMPKDVAAMVMNVQRAGLAVTGYEVEKVEDAMGAYTSHVVRITPVEGASSKLQFMLPVVEDDGTYRSGGVKYRMRKQRGDLPIRKIAPDRVALTSYYGKVFVSRSSKKVNDYGNWLRNHVMAIGLDREDLRITEIQPADVFDSKFKAPKVYSAVAMGFRSFYINVPARQVVRTGEDGTEATTTVPARTWELNFDRTRREKIFGADALKAYETNGSLVIGIADEAGVLTYLVLDEGGTLYAGSAGRIVDIGTLESLLDLPGAKAPVDFCELKVMGRTIPMGLVLGYELGLDRLMQLLGVTPRRVTAGTRVQLADDEYSLVFSDETLVFSKDDALAALVLAGFNEYHKTIRGFGVYDFDQRGVYLNVLETQGAAARYLKELDLLNQMFIDPITRDLLVEMKEPTEFRGLLMRSCEMLMLDQHPDELDPAFMRIKGYERMAGAVYSEVVKSIRSHNGRTGKARLPIDLNPYAVWTNIAKDPSIAMVSDINPIENLKQQEAVTFSGTGGRGSRSMTKHTRSYHPNDMGTMSESTVDSGDVGINTFLSADPQFTTLRGISKRYKKGESGATNLFSTSALLSVGSDRDDPKRVNFVGIQHSHGIACDGYTQSAVRTGYEQVLAHRTSDLFALTAKQNGRVVSVSEQGLVIEYEDGETKGIELGRRYGNAAGLVIPHSVVSELKVGERFKAGRLLCYNSGFFEKDVLNPNQAIWKVGVLVNTVLLESSQTLEDSSAISQETAKLLTTQITKVRTVVVNFEQSVHQLVKVGDIIDTEDILCIIEDPVSANTGLFTEASLDTLRVVSNATPMAKAKGVVERIEVFYHGELEDMTETLRKQTMDANRDMARRAREAGKAVFTGAVDDGFRIDGDPLVLDTLAIRIYITSDVTAGVGDKGVFCNQLKTVFGEVMAGEVITESGIKIGAIFGQKSVADRIVISPDILGTTTTLLDVIAKRAVAAYKK
jgi:hypothetical protein